MAQCWMSGEKSTQEGREGAAQELENHVLGCWEPRSWDRWSKNEKNSDALDTGGSHDVRMGNIPSLEWFQVIPNGKSRLTHSHTRTLVCQEIGYYSPLTNCIAIVVTPW